MVRTHGWSLARSLALLMLAVLVLAACSEAAEDASAPMVEADRPVDAAAPEPDGDEAADGAAGAEPDASGVAGDREAPLPPVTRQAGRTPERIIKEGTVTLEVDEGSFMSAYERVVETARRHGGSVSATTSRKDDHGRTTGSITVRVPVEAYEDLLVGVGRIGELVEQDITSRDVSGEVVDLEARLRHLRAQERFYLGLLDDAEGVRDAIAVQQQVGDIQQRVEQLQGRLDHLEDRAAFSTLTVELVEAGADPVLASAEGERTLAAYWQQARTGFVTVVGWGLVALVTLAPVLAPLALAALLWRLARRRGPTPATVSGDSG